MPARAQRGGDPSAVDGHRDGEPDALEGAAEAQRSGRGQEPLAAAPAPAGATGVGRRRRRRASCRRVRRPVRWRTRAWERRRGRTPAWRPAGSRRRSSRGHGPGLQRVRGAARSAREAVERPRGPQRELEVEDLQAGPGERRRPGDLADADPGVGRVAAGRQREPAVRAGLRGLRAAVDDLRVRAVGQRVVAAHRVRRRDGELDAERRNDLWDHRLVAAAARPRRSSRRRRRPRRPAGSPAGRPACRCESTCRPPRSSRRPLRSTGRSARRPPRAGRSPTRPRRSAEPVAPAPIADVMASTAATRSPQSLIVISSSK